jgi:hypothetical protein
MSLVSKVSPATLIISILGFILPAAPAAAQAAQDVVTVATVSGSGVVDVPVFIRDVATTPLGIDQPAGSRIQSYSIKVNYSPASAVQSITFSRAGITAGLTPTFETSPAAPGTISLLDTFPESSNLIPFTLNAPAPGNQVGHLLVTLSPSALPGTTITLTLDPVLTELTDEGGTPGTAEISGNGRLALVSGAITVVGAAGAPVGGPMLGSWALVLLACALVLVAVRMLP